MIQPQMPPSIESILLKIQFDRTVQSAREACEQLTRATMDYAYKLDNILNEKALDFIIEPCVRTATFSERIPDVAYKEFAELRAYTLKKRERIDAEQLIGPEQRTRITPLKERYDERHSKLCSRLGSLMELEQFLYERLKQLGCDVMPCQVLYGSKIPPYTSNQKSQQGILN